MERFKKHLKCVGICLSVFVCIIAFLVFGLAYVFGAVTLGNYLFGPVWGPGISGAIAIFGPMAAMIGYEICKNK